ncbi:MAG: hypothetical protein V7L20_25865 [Nostoc sp.]|uniref:hypothetical protein n=1 Tax=Nostoc sp. TaxID=1180 RepID=UPI002FFA3BF9
MDTITTAIVTAVSAGLAKDLITDSYNSFKNVLKKKFGEKSDLLNAVDKLEKMPDCEVHKAIVQQEVEVAKVNNDLEMLQLAQDLLDKIKQQPGAQEIIDLLQKSLTPHPQPLPLLRGGETKRSFGSLGFLFLIYARGLINVEECNQLESEKPKNRKREIKRLRQTTFGAITAGLIIAGFTIFTLKSVQSSERGQPEEIIRSAWLGLNRSNMTELEKYQECGTYLNVGLRSLYCDIKPFIDYQKLRILSGLPIFRKDYDLTFKSEYKFGYYNPEFVKWLQKNIIYAEKHESFRQQTQTSYNTKIRDTARAFYTSYQILFATPEEFNTFIKQYQLVKKEYQLRLEKREVNELRFDKNYEKFEVIKREYLKHLENKTLPDLYFQEKFRWLSDYLTTVENVDWYAANTSGGFWIRRSIDETDKEFFQLLTKLLKTYDGDWLRKRESLGVKPSR